MTVEELLEEYSEALPGGMKRLVGNKIYSRVRSLTQRYLRKRDPRSYAHGAYDYRDALDDVSHDFVLDVLIGERQIDYIMSVATTIDDFDRLVQYQLRRFLARTRNRTVIDAIVKRAVDRVSEHPFVAVSAGCFGLESRNYDAAPSVQDSELRRAAALAQSVPKLRDLGGDRQPVIYDEERLAAVLVILASQVSGPVCRPDLQTFFEYLLTSWTGSLLGSLEDEEPRERSLGPEERTLVVETTSRLVGSMSPEERTMFRMKHTNLPDRVLAEALGVSRPTLSTRKAALFERIREELVALDRTLHEAVLREMTIVIATEDRL